MSVCGQDFWRIRFGIGRPENKEEVSEYVLSNFNEDSSEINRLIEEAVDLIIEQYKTDS